VVVCRSVLGEEAAQQYLRELTAQLLTSLDPGGCACPHLECGQGTSPASSNSAGWRSGVIPLAAPQHLPLLIAYRPLVFYLMTETVGILAHLVLVSRLGFCRAAATSHTIFYVRPGRWLGDWGTCSGRS
jgi:hypothetical protein